MADVFAQRGRAQRYGFAILFASCCFPSIGRAEEPAGQVVRFETADGIEIVGDYFPPDNASRPAPGVVLVHMLRTDRHSWQPLIPVLHQAGFAVLAMDLRGHGDSGAPHLASLRERVRDQDIVVFHEMDRDVEAAVSWMVRREEVDAARLALVGATVGFSVALQYAVRDPSIDVLVGLTPGGGFVGLDSNSAALRYGRRPMLLLAVETDRRALDTLARLNRDVVTEVVGGGTGHGTRMFRQYKHVPGRIAEFLTAHLGERSDAPVVVALGDERYFPDVPRLRAVLPDVDPQRIRWCSSAKEAEERGLKPAS